MPLASLRTAWKIRSPLRVGMIPFETTVPITVPSRPTSIFTIGVMVLASS